MATPIGPDFIALQVRDLAASAQFYKDVFGFEVEAQSPPGAVVLKTKPISLALREPLILFLIPVRSALAWPSGLRAMMPTSSTT
jgi:catechol 2,3-dioxygenase-like lactoylglutathione lyase family enzyme